MIGRCRAKTNPMLEAFSTYELKAELRHRRREGSLLRWILWRLGWKLGWERLK